MRRLFFLFLVMGAGPACAQNSNPLTNGIQFAGACPTTASAGTMCLKATNSITSSASIGSGPARAFIFSITMSETAGYAVTINIGTTPGGADVASGLFVPASGSLLVTPQALSSAWFATSQPLYLSSSSWGRASINEQTEYLVGP